MTQKKLSTSSEEGSEYTQQVWRESIKDLLRYDTTFCLAAQLPISIGCTGQTVLKIKNNFDSLCEDCIDYIHLDYR